MGNRLVSPIIVPRLLGNFDLDSIVQTIDLGAGETFRVSPSGGGVLQATHLPAFKNETPNDGDVPTWSAANTQYEASAPSGGGIEKYSNTAASSATSGNGLSTYDISHTIPAGSLDELGKILRVYCFGSHYGSSFDPSAYWRLRLGGVNLKQTSTVSLTAGVTKWFSLEFESIVWTAGSSGVLSTVVRYAVYNNNNFIALATRLSSNTIDLTAAKTLDLQIFFQGTGATSTLDHFTAEVL